MKSISMLISDLEESLYEINSADVITFEMKSRFDEAVKLLEQNRVAMTSEENAYVERLLT